MEATRACDSDLLRTTWALAWPVIFSFSVESFVGLCDMLMVGRLGGTAVAGVGVGVQILGAVDSVMFALGMGALAIVARHVGASERAAAEETLRQSLLTAAAVAVLMILPVLVWAPALVAAFRVEGAVVAAGTRFLRIVYPAAIEHLLMQIGFFIYIVFAAHPGTAAVAAYFIGVRILSLSFLPGFGFAAAAATMIGQNLGAERPENAERSGRAAVRLAVRLMSVAGLLIFAAARPIARLFVDDAAVVADTVSFIRVLAACQPLMALDFTLGGALRGAGDTRF